MDNKTRGKYGEDLAVSFLVKKGFEILERNYRYQRGEVDVIGLWNNELMVFFEVKIRKNTDFGLPETFVTEAQKKRIIHAAEDYILGVNWHKDIRFDIIAICGDQVSHIEDAFY